MSSRTQTKRQTKPKASPRTQDSSKLGFSAQAVTFPSDPDLEALEEERVELQSPGAVSKAAAKQIDNSPGYDIDQLTHMVEYWDAG